MPATNPFKHLDVHTTKGAALMAAGQSVAQGQPDVAALVTSGAFTDRETVTVDGDVYELVDLSTDTTVDVLTFWNNTNVEITQTAIDPADYSFSVGEYVAVESEIAIVTYITVNSATDWDVSFYRGVAGTTVAAHATGTTAIEAKEATALTAGAITVPATAVTQIVGLPALEAVIGGTNRGPGGYNGVVNSLPAVASPNWEFRNLDNTTGLLVSTVGGSRGATVAETGANMAWDETTTNGGDTVNASPHVTFTRVPTSAEVTAGNIFIACNFKPLAANVYVYTTATGAAVSYDGSATVNQTDNVIIVDNSGLTDWTVATTVVVQVIGAPVPVADCVVLG